MVAHLAVLIEKPPRGYGPTPPIAVSVRLSAENGHEALSTLVGMLRARVFSQVRKSSTSGVHEI